MTKAKTKYFEVKCPNCKQFIFTVNIIGKANYRTKGTGHLVQGSFPYSFKDPNEFHCFGSINFNIFDASTEIRCSKCDWLITSSVGDLSLDDVADVLEVLERRRVKDK